VFAQPLATKNGARSGLVPCYRAGQPSVASDDPDVTNLSQLPITVVMNTASGHDDKQSSRGDIERTLMAAGREFRVCAPDVPDQLEALACRLVEEAKAHPCIIVAAGGDGTINTVAGAVAGTGIPFGVVPLGTFNFFARNLGIPLDAAGATQALLDGRTKPSHVGRVNGHVFLINSSVGLYRRLQEEREQFKRRFGRTKLTAMISGLLTLLRHHRTYRVQMDIDSQPVTVRTPMLFFGMNTLQLEKLDLPVADCTVRGLLAVLVLRPMSRLKLLGFAMRGALQGLGDAENLHMHCASKVLVHWRRARQIKVAIDGETIICSQPLHYEVLRNGLNVVVPRDPEPRE
jgi:diacylglycerol kinase family enzyme